ncbi:ATP-dependent endonuclease [Puniceicoccaceae bacterium K14]|nr:ATP-dependent endonuclease [Puniceicoccaceae bacterium K14]
MKLNKICIQNFKSCKNITLELGDLHALVGSNNAGKSTILKALDFLFNPSTRSLNEDSFWNRDTSLEIRVEAEFFELTEWETESLSGCLDGESFVVARTAKMGAEDSAGDSDDTESKIKIGQEYRKQIPEVEWLRDSAISGTRIAEWWKDKDQLKIGEHDFAIQLGSTKPAVGAWKGFAEKFIEDHKDQIPMKSDWIANPKGYANVLKKTLPFFVLVPAVRDIGDESKGTKSSPFGKLLYAVIDSVADDKKKEIDLMLKNLALQMNRSGGEKRVEPIKKAEDRLNTLLGDFFKDVDLEIEFEAPTLETILTSPKLFVNDGFRNAIENKGHGLQRAVIFTILRRYAEFMAEDGDKDSHRSIFLAVEEPELYMHPLAQRTIRSVFKALADQSAQVMYSTHSSLLVDVSYFDEVIRLETEIGSNGDRSSTAYQLSVQELIDDVVSRNPNLKEKISEQSIRDLYSHAYNPRRSEGFFATKIILVEGATEEYSLPIYANAIEGLNLDSQGISVVECGGKGPMDRLYRIFNELRIPCYLLFDYDTGNSDAEIIKKSKELLSLCGYDESEPASVIVEGNFSCFKQTWEKDLAPEIADAASLKTEAKQFLGLGKSSGKPLIARYTARKLVEKTPPEIPPTIEKMLRKAVQVSWGKTCLHKVANSEEGS